MLPKASDPYELSVCLAVVRYLRGQPLDGTDRLGEDAMIVVRRALVDGIETPIEAHNRSRVAACGFLCGAISRSNGAEGACHRPKGHGGLHNDGDIDYADDGKPIIPKPRYTESGH